MSVPVCARASMPVLPEDTRSPLSTLDRWRTRTNERPRCPAGRGLTWITVLGAAVPPGPGSVRKLCPHWEPPGLGAHAFLPGSGDGEGSCLPKSPLYRRR